MTNEWTAGSNLFNWISLSESSVGEHGPLSYYGPQPSITIEGIRNTQLSMATIAGRYCTSNHVGEKNCHN